MCFSAAASFAVGVPLIPVGVYCLWSAAVKKPSYLGLAAVPLCFGVQQVSEGFVWHALEHHDYAQVQMASLVYLFFALAFWPFWFPLLTLVMEPRGPRQILLLLLTMLAASWFFILFLPILLAPDTILTTEVFHHSLRYEYPDLPIYRLISKGPLRVLYFLSVALPMVLGSQSWGRIPGLVLGASALVAALLFEYAFVSVWCFFAAVLALYLVFVFYRLPVPPSDSSAAAIR